MTPLERNANVVLSCSWHLLITQCKQGTQNEAIFQLAGIYQFRAFPLFYHDSRFWHYSLYFSRQNSRLYVGNMGNEQTILAKPAYHFWLFFFDSFTLSSILYKLESLFLLSQKQNEGGITEPPGTSCDRRALSLVWCRYVLQDSAIFRNS